MHKNSCSLFPKLKIEQSLVFFSQSNKMWYLVTNPLIWHHTVKQNKPQTLTENNSKKNLRCQRFKHWMNTKIPDKNNHWTPHWVPSNNLDKIKQSVTQNESMFPHTLTHRTQLNRKKQKSTRNKKWSLEYYACIYFSLLVRYHFLKFTFVYHFSFCRERHSFLLQFGVALHVLAFPLVKPFLMNQK